MLYKYFIRRLILTFYVYQLIHYLEKVYVHLLNMHIKSVDYFFVEPYYIGLLTLNISKTNIIEMRKESSLVI